MEDKIVKSEVADLALLKGFEEDCFYHYNYGLLLENYVINKQHVATHHLFANNYDFEIERWGGGHKYSIPAPYLSVLQKWLRETQNIHVYAFYDPILHYYYVNVNGDILNKRVDDKNCPEFESYEDALEYGVEDALKNITYL